MPINSLARSSSVFHINLLLQIPLLHSERVRVVTTPAPGFNTAEILDAPFFVVDDNAIIGFSF